MHDKSWFGLFMGGLCHVCVVLVGIVAAGLTATSRFLTDVGSLLMGRERSKSVSYSIVDGDPDEEIPTCVRVRLTCANRSRKELLEIVKAAAVGVFSTLQGSSIEGPLDDDEDEESEDDDGDDGEEFNEDVEAERAENDREEGEGEYQGNGEADKPAEAPIPRRRTAAQAG